MNVKGRSRLPLRLALATTLAGLAVPALAQDAAAWRVECAGDGKTLDCYAVQQLLNRDDKQLVAQLTARTAPDTKAPVLIIRLPLGINLTEPVRLQVDSGAVERLTVQMCTNAGCIVSLPLKDAVLAALRGGTTLKITLQGAGNRTITIDVPLLGFGLAFDRAIK